MVAWLYALAGLIAPVVAAAATISDSATFFSTHSSIKYFPRSYCVHYTIWGCSGRNYAWQYYDYEDHRTGLDRSFAVVTNEHNNGMGNGHREIIFTLPRAREVHFYGVPRIKTSGHHMALQELCIEDRPCILLDVEGAYLSAENEHDPVLVWSGSLSSMSARHSVNATLRMIEPAHHQGQVPKWMTLDSVVCTGLYAPLRQQPLIYTPPINSTLRDITMEDTNRAILYRPRDRWTIITRDLAVFETFTQTSTIYNANERTLMPEASFDFQGCAVKIWMAPRSQLQFTPGSLEVCLDAACEFVDAHQLYLNIPRASSPLSLQVLNISSDHFSLSDDPVDQPVLLWAASGLNYKQTHLVVIRLIEKNPELDQRMGERRRGLALDHVTYTKVFEPFRLPFFPQINCPTMMIMSMVMFIVLFIILFLSHRQRYSWKTERKSKVLAAHQFSIVASRFLNQIRKD